MGTNEDTVQEKVAMAILTGSMYSLNFLKNITTAIFDPKLQLLTVSEIYDQWLRMTGLSKIHETHHIPIPYNFGSIFGGLYCGVLLAKEKWFDLLPEDKIDGSSADWGFSSIKYSAPQEPSPTIKYVFKRIRNALGHGHIFIDVPIGVQKNEKDKDDFEKTITLKFHDENQRKPGDTFDIEITLFGLYTAIKKFHSIAYSHVTEKNDIEI
ncbi:MAG: HEPN family nuclease [Dissulfurispiraceae bacterium]|jgi:hypothetical protein